MRIVVLLFLAASLALSSPVMASGHSGRHTGGSHSRGSHTSGSHSGRSHVSRSHSRHASHRHRASSHTRHHNRNYSYGLRRDSHGRIIRSQQAKNDFKRQHPCPSTGKSRGACPGYVIDHVQALKHGGADAASNMQWQTKEAAKQKDKWE